MKTILNAAHNVAALIRDRHPERAEDCRRSIYAVEADCPDGKLLYHTLSGELLLLEPGEDPDAPALRRELTERRFLVPRTLDEKKLCDQTRNVLRLTQSESGHVTSYVVFTTTDCNARCYYCFERGQRRLTMSAETADDVAAWMLAHCGGEDITVRWFGGEPLVNVGAIDRISRTLRDSGASYRSVMFSNAFLFTPELVKRAAELWQLRQVVVTLDGTEEVYNRTKAYVGVRESAFPRVLDNIDSLLDAAVRVTVNLNMDANNADDLFRLAELLGSRFGGREGFSARAGLLQEYAAPIPAFETSRQALARWEALNKRLRALGIHEKKSPGGGLLLNACMADSARSVTVLPDGRLGRCEHFGDREEVGSIYDDAPDAEKLRQWQALRPPQAECAACFWYPQCLRPVKCNSAPERCEDFHRELRAISLRQKMLNAWEKRRSAEGNGDNDETEI